METYKVLANANVLIRSLPGQRMSSCTCQGEDHAGPDVTYGRGVPEIDVLEGQIDLSVNIGQVSQSAQFAPVSLLLSSFSNFEISATHDCIHADSLTKDTNTSTPLKELFNTIQTSQCGTRTKAERIRKRYHL